MLSGTLAISLLMEATMVTVVVAVKLRGSVKMVITVGWVIRMMG